MPFASHKGKKISKRINTFDTVGIVLQYYEEDTNFKCSGVSSGHIENML